MARLLPRIADRIALRRLAAADLRAFQAYRTDPEVGRYQGWEVESDDDAGAFLVAASTALLLVPGEWCQIGIAERATDTLIGDVGICLAPDGTSAEIGFTLCREAQGRGLAAEAVREAIALTFDRTPATRIVCITDARNTACIRLLERLGMTRVASLAATFRDEPCVEHTYVLMRDARVPTPPTQVVPFDPHFASDVVRLILSIQRDEFGIDITAAQQPDLHDVPAVYQVAGGNFWVALAGARVVGTIALLDIGDGQAALRKLFVHRDFRGRESGTGRRLLDTAIAWAGDHAIREIFLGTTEQLRAAHRFYEKHGFAEIGKAALPARFPVMAVDTRFFHRRLAAGE